MGLQQRKIEWIEDAPRVAATAEATPSPALLLQQLLEDNRLALTRPRMSREQVRKMIMTSAAGAFSLWFALIASANMAVRVIA